jgi:hypothetical protein
MTLLQMLLQPSPKTGFFPSEINVKQCFSETPASRPDLKHCFNMLLQTLQKTGVLSMKSICSSASLAPQKKVIFEPSLLGEAKHVSPPKGRARARTRAREGRRVDRQIWRPATIGEYASLAEVVDAMAREVLAGFDHANRCHAMLVDFSFAQP